MILAETQNILPFVNRTCQGHTEDCEHQFQECNFSWRVGNFFSDFLQILPNWMSSLFSGYTAFSSTDMEFSEFKPWGTIFLKVLAAGFLFQSTSNILPPGPTLTYCWRWCTISSSLLQSDGCANKLKTTCKGNTIQRS